MQPGEVVDAAGVAVLGNPQLGDEEAVEAHHVEQGHGAVHRPADLRALSQSGAHQQAAVAATTNGEAGPGGEALGHQPVGGGEEVVEAALLVRSHAGLVPVLAVLGPAADAGDGVDAAGVGHRHRHRRPRRAVGDGKAAVAGQQRRRVGRGPGGGPANEEHGHRRAVGGRVGDLVDRVVTGTGAAGGGVAPVLQPGGRPAQQARRPGEGAEGQERPLLVMVGVEAGQAADARQRHLGFAGAVEAIAVERGHGHLGGGDEQ